MAKDRKVLGPVKVAFRDEGEFVVCYVAATQGEWFVEIARVRKIPLELDKEFWQDWKNLQWKIGKRFIEEALKTKVISGTELPPDLLEFKPERKD